MQTLSVPTGTHGRVLLRQPAGSPIGCLVGFHGYMENAEIQMTRLEGIPGAERWTVASVQALHRFYRGRSQDVVASWMTRQDREQAIEDNIAYAQRATARVSTDAGAPIVFAGFSQGVAMAFRAAIACGRPAAVLACGGDIPPEIEPTALRTLPAVLLGRGRDDDWYTAEKLDADVARLTTAGILPDVVVYDGGHTWTLAFAESAAALLRRLHT